MQHLTKEMVVASLLPELTKLNWQQLFDAANAIVPSRGTLGVNYADALKLRDLYDALKKRRSLEDKADKDRIKARKEGYDVYMKPIEAVLEKIDPELARINAEIIDEEGYILEEIEQKNEIRERHISFVNDMIKQAMEAPDVKDLGRIQMLVGSEKARKSYYGDYHPHIEKSCDSLLGLIEGRKNVLKGNVKLLKDYNKAVEKGDLAEAAHIKRDIEDNERVVNQNALNIAQQAYEQVAAVKMVDENLQSAAIKPRLRRWAWRVDNIELLNKKMPSLVELAPRKGDINLFMKSKVEEGDLKPWGDNEFNGLVIFRKPFYVSIKSKNEAEEE